MKTLNEDIRQTLREHGENIRNGIISRMAQLGRNATGKTAASLQVESGASYVTVTGGQQFQYLQRGRGAGKVPYGFRDTIKEWIKAKGIAYGDNGKDPEKALNSLAYVISRNIMQKGTSLHRRGGYDNIYDSVIDDEVAKLANASEKVVAKKIDELNNGFSK